MLREHLSLFCLLGCLPGAVLSGPAQDARFIAEQHILCDDVAGKLEALEQSVFADMQPAAEKMGATILDPERFMHDLTGAFADTFVQDLAAASADAFAKVLTPQELSDLAGYYSSTEGEALLACAPKTAADVARIGFWQEGPGAPILEQLPLLQANMVRFILEGLSAVRSSFTTQRLAEIFENPEIIGFEDEAQRAKVVEGLRRMDG